MIAPHRQVHHFISLAHHPFFLFPKMTVFFNFILSHLYIFCQLFFPKTFHLTHSCKHHFFPHGSGIHHCSLSGQFFIFDLGCLHADINPIQKRLAQLSLIIPDLPGRTGALRTRSHSTGTWIRCSNQHKVCRKNISSLLPCQMNAFFFQRLPEHLQNTSWELRQLIQEKDTSMRKCCFSRRWDSSASDECCPRHGMMDLPERSLPDQRILSFKQSRRTVNPRDLQTFFTVKRW